jgi:hypothetical protein
MARKPTISDPVPKDAPDLHWEMAVPLVTHPLMLAGILKAFTLAAVMMSLLLSFLMAVTGGTDTIPMMIALSFGTAGALLVVGLAASAIIYGNRMHMRFSLDQHAARAEVTDTRAKAVSIAAIALGALAGKPGAVGTGLITLSDRDRRAAWRGVVSVKYHPRFKAVSLSNAWRTVMILFCTDDNYEAVAAYVGAAVTQHPVAAAARTNPLPKLLLHTGLIILACVPLFSFDHPLKIDIFVPLLVLCFALAMLWLIPLMAYVVWAGLGYLAVVIGLQLMAERTSSFRSLGNYRAYDVLSGDDITMLVAAALGAAYLIWLSRGLMSGRIRAALAGDMADLDDD